VDILFVPSLQQLCFIYYHTVIDVSILKFIPFQKLKYCLLQSMDCSKKIMKMAFGDCLQINHSYEARLFDELLKKSKIKLTIVDLQSFIRCYRLLHYFIIIVLLFF
jgi:hypothetical protein